MQFCPVLRKECLVCPCRSFYDWCILYSTHRRRWITHSIPQLSSTFSHQNALFLRSNDYQKLAYSAIDGHVFRLGEALRPIPIWDERSLAYHSPGTPNVTWCPMRTSQSARVVRDPDVSRRTRGHGTGSDVMRGSRGWGGRRLRIQLRRSRGPTTPAGAVRGYSVMIISQRRKRFTRGTAAECIPRTAPCERTRLQHCKALQHRRIPPEPQHGWGWGYYRM